jgi:hypothetical protein
VKLFLCLNIFTLDYEYISTYFDIIIEKSEDNIGMKKLIFLLMLPVLLAGQDQAVLEPTGLIDVPTAGMLKRGSYQLQLRAYAAGGLLTSIDVGISNRFMIGIAYGGTNIVGRGKIDWNPQPGVHVRYRLWEEQLTLPALVLGYHSQGYDAYIDSTNRYLVKSMGIFAVASKNFSLLGNLGIHGGLNYSFERGDGDKDLNFFLGLDKNLNPELALIAEYNFAFNDNDHRALGSGEGYLNGGIRWTFAGKLEIDFLLRNILHNKNEFEKISREIKITYAEIF